MMIRRRRANSLPAPAKAFAATKDRLTTRKYALAGEQPVPCPRFCRSFLAAALQAMLESKPRKMATSKELFRWRRNGNSIC